MHHTQVAPTALEIGLVSTILATKFGFGHAVVTCVTVAAYTVFTVQISNGRIAIRKAMNSAEQQANGRAIDALMNYETVKYFGTEEMEAKR